MKDLVGKCVEVCINASIMQGFVKEVSPDYIKIIELSNCEVLVFVKYVEYIRITNQNSMQMNAVNTSHMSAKRYSLNQDEVSPFETHFNETYNDNDFSMSVSNLNNSEGGVKFERQTKRDK